MPLRPRQWRRRFWHPAVAKAGLEAWTPHALRHTFVSFLIDQGLPVEKVCEQTRHRHPGFTRRVYRHRFEEASSDVAEALERARTASRRPAASSEVAELPLRDAGPEIRRSL
jgi:integrase